MQRSMAGDGTTDHPLRRVRIEHFGIWVLPRFLETPRHVSATIFDFRRKLVLLACTMSLRQDVFVTRALAYVGLLMTALNGGDRWTWSDWRYIDLMGPTDPTQQQLCCLGAACRAAPQSRRRRANRVDRTRHEYRAGRVLTASAVRCAARSKVGGSRSCCPGALDASRLHTHRDGERPVTCSACKLPAGARRSVQAAQRRRSTRLRTHDVWAAHVAPVFQERW